MNFDTLMRTCWKKGDELPSDTLLRENPAAYDSSPMPCSRSSLEFEHGYKPWVTGGASATKNSSRAPSKQGPRFTPKKVREKVEVHGMTLHKGVCAICRDDTGLTRHHLTPKQVRHLAPVGCRVNKTIRICIPCHKTLHIRFTNQQLLNVPWEDVSEIVLESRKIPIDSRP